MLAEFIKLPKEGETIGQYVLNKVLSSSILGTFYQATNSEKNAGVLIHIIPEALLRADSRFVQRYKDAVERQKQLHSGSVMKVHELHRIDGNLVVEYPRGNYKSMTSAVLKQEERFSEEHVQGLLIKIAKGLMIAQKIELGHYFMTPDFLFLDDRGEIRVAGIGLFQSIQYESFERFVSGAVIPVSLDKTKSFTALEILSPEIRNFKSRDQRSDFYCLGMCAYFLLTGEKPSRRWATPTEARQGLSRGWDVFINSCLEPKPSDRFANYRSFLNDLESVDELAKVAKKRARKRFSPGLPDLMTSRWMENRLSFRGVRLTRLLLLGLAGILAIGSGSIFTYIIFSDFDEESAGHSIRRVGNASAANLIITASPAEVQISVMGPSSGRFIPSGKTIYLKGRNGIYKLVAKARGYRPISREVQLSGSEKIQLDFTLTPDFATININGAVGTEVYVMPESGLMLHLGTIESTSGLQLSDKLLVGNHKLVGLHETLMPAIIEDKSIGRTGEEITFKQIPKPTQLIVQSSPEGAVVTVDGSQLGLTPLKVEGLLVGRKLKLSVAKEGYREVSRELTFDPGEKITVDTGKLELKIGTLSYTIDLSMPNPPDMRELMFSVNGEMLAVKESGILELPEGGHMVKLEHPDYYPFDERIVVLDRKVTNVEITLEPRPVRLIPEVSIDAPTRYYVEGVETPLTEQGILPIEANRPVEVTAMIRDHLNVTQSFQGMPNERMEWEVPIRAIPGPTTGKDYSPPYFDLEMVWLPEGEFKLGSPLDEFRRIPNEDNRTEVELTSGFWISAQEVTQRDYQRLMRENPSQFSGPNHPVDSVNWEQANEFCQRLTIFEREAGRLPDGWRYRLPTEAEWEYAAKAGTETPFSFGDTASPEDGNFQGYYAPGETRGSATGERYGTMPVASFEPNAYGIYDVHGNVAEWTLDRFWDRHPGGNLEDPVNLSRGRGYTIKGGSWKDSADRVRSAAREGAPESSERNSLGFRVVLGPEPKEMD